VFAYDDRSYGSFHLLISHVRSILSTSLDLPRLLGSFGFEIKASSCHPLILFGSFIAFVVGQVLPILFLACTSTKRSSL
jgi:hypothetical protein